MATGIEIAGLLLGAMPLVISALENYEKMLDPVKAMFNYGSELSRATRVLDNSYTSYKQSMQLLLAPGTEKEKLHIMMKNTDSEYWKETEIVEALQERLGTSYKSYMWTLKEIDIVIMYIAKHISIEGADKITKESLEAIIAASPPKIKNGKIEFRKRVKFTMKRKKIRSSLDELAKHISQLDSYLDKADKLEETQLASHKSRFASPLSLMQKNAAMLYTALSKTWCSDHSTHSAGLLLEHRLVTRNKRRAGRRHCQQPEKCDSSCFSVSLLQPSADGKWLEVEFRMVEAPSMSGFYVDNGNLRGAYSAHHRTVTYINDSISLDKILAGNSRSLSMTEIYILSITLISSLLQLSETPWLEQSWHKSDILFLRATDGSSVKADIKHPYLAREHKPDPIQQARYNVFFGKDSSKILALGILFLEIFCGHPIEKLRQLKNVGACNEPNDLINLGVVRRWLEELYTKGDITFGFKSAILHCLQCSLDPSADLQDLEFARAIEEKVLAPLENEQSFILSGIYAG
ncbi:MAG: hypothetical protein M1829_005236 [Trizodia sp. TS-e1964]|nr:MAG: hypothetical protein M1829_005236 [Trizodia sp. TS-e1964]